MFGLIEAIYGVVTMSSSEESIDDIPLSSRMKINEIKRKRTPTSSHGSAMKEWTDDEIIPSLSQKRTKFKHVKLDSEPKNLPSHQEGASSPKDAPSPLSESEFQKRASESNRYSVSPQHYNPPFKHWTPLKEELDFDWEGLENELSEQEKNVWRKKRDKLSCVGLDSTVIDVEIDWCMRYYDMEGIWACPLRKMRPHIFNIENLIIPRMVLSPKLLSLGVGAP